MRRLPITLLGAYFILFIILSFNPVNRLHWAGGNIIIMFIVLFLVLTYKKFQFSDTSYILMSFLIFMHTIGVYFSFANVPFDFISELFNFSRNNFDRLTHFTVGFYAYPVAEYLHAKKIVKQSALFLTSVLMLIAVAGIFEIVEWLFVDLFSPLKTANALGAQGDIWDAQKDMLADSLGAICAMLFYKLKH